jgi:RNA polymerase sigma factor (sigma-70 family)
MSASQRIESKSIAPPEPDGKLISINEYQLWKEFKSGDDAAYALIYRRYFFILYNYGKKISRDNELVKDAIQDLFIKVWNNRQKLSDTTSIKYYLLTSLKRKLLDTLESPVVRLKTEDDVLEFEVTDTSDLEEEAFHDQKERVLHAMNKLSGHQQRLLQMKFYKNQSNQEIAEELGITIQSVYNSVFKTLRSIRKQLQAMIWIAILSLFL